MSDFSIIFQYRDGTSADKQTDVQNSKLEKAKKGKKQVIVLSL
jgi:hypothetical protein